MIRLAWRQMRVTVITTVVLLAGLGVVVALYRDGLMSAMDSSGLAGCLAAGGDCTGLVDAFIDANADPLGTLGMLIYAPLLIGLFWGGPVISREVEQGTHRLVWTQSISPSRWFAVRIALLLAGASLVGTVIALLFAWFAQPYMRLGAEGYSAINPPFYALPAMAVALAAFLMPWLLLREARSGLLSPGVLTYPVNRPNPRTGLGDWQLHPATWVDAAGVPVVPEHLDAWCGEVINPNKPGAFNADCLAAHGVRYEYVYQPLSRFWSLQAVESGILLGASLLLLAVAAWWTTRRVS
jgi:hypothetical protein